MALVHFLLVYDRPAEKLIFEQPYSDPVEALHEYEAMEEKHRHDRHLEIVLVGADSIETVMLTHANYFDGERAGQAAVSPYLAGV